MRAVLSLKAARIHVDRAAQHARPHGPAKGSDRDHAATPPLPIAACVQVHSEGSSRLTAQALQLQLDRYRLGCL